MTKIKKNIAEYDHFFRVTDPKIIEEIRKVNLDYENIPQDTYYELCKLLKINVN